MANIAECEKAGIDPKEVDKIARRINRIMKDANKLGIYLFCGSSNTLYAVDNHPRRLIISDELSFHNCDGGCGACGEDEEGLMRGE